MGNEEGDYDLANVLLFWILKVVCDLIWARSLECVTLSK